MGAQSHKILLLVLAGPLLLSVLSGCGPEYLTEEQVKEEALDYLSSRYSAEFTVTAAEEKISGPSPIPSFKSKPTYWILTAASSQFPNETFTVMRSVSGNLIDNYYSLLLNDEAVGFFDEFVSESFDGDYLITIGWTIFGWPEGVSEGATFQEWAEAGGYIPLLEIYLCDTEPEETVCEPLAEKMRQNYPEMGSIFFWGITNEGFTYMREQPISTCIIPNGYYKKWVLKRINY